MYKRCIVPLCKNNTKETPHKKFIFVTRKRREAWFRAVKKDLNECKSHAFCCEDHFKFPESASNWDEHIKYNKPLKIKENILPEVKFRKRTFEYIETNGDTNQKKLHVQFKCNEEKENSTPSNEDILLDHSIFSSLQNSELSNSSDCFSFNNITDYVNAASIDHTYFNQFENASIKSEITSDEDTQFIASSNNIVLIKSEITSDTETKINLDIGSTVSYSNNISIKSEIPSDIESKKSEINSDKDLIALNNNNNKFTISSDKDTSSNRLKNTSETKTISDISTDSTPTSNITSYSCNKLKMILENDSNKLKLSKCKNLKENKPFLYVCLPEAYYF